MNVKTGFLSLLLAFAFLLPTDLHAAGLRAGLAKVEITPDEPAWMGGYSSRDHPSEGTFDPLHARALVLDDGERTMALVAVDLIWLPSERIPKVAKEKLGVDLVLMAASHTHSGPDFLYDVRWDDKEKFRRVFRRTEDLVLKAIEEAKADMFPARLATARGEIALGYHRLVMQPNGRRKPLWRNPERVPIGPVDPEVPIIRIEDADAGTTRGIVVNYATHAVCHGGGNYKFSADYPGHMAAKVERELGDGAICLFTQGGCGSVNPMFMVQKSDPEADQQRAITMGELLADEVLRALPSAEPVKGPDEVLWRTHVETFQHRWRTTDTVNVGTANVLINKTIAIASMPGEPFLKHQTNFKREAPAPFPIFLGYTNSVDPGWPQYIPDIRSAAEGGYGADSRTRLEVGAGERLVNQALIDIFDMRGMYGDVEGEWGGKGAEKLKAMH